MVKTTSPCHQEMYNAQSILKEYTEYMKLSTRVQHDSAELAATATKPNYFLSTYGEVDANATEKYLFSQKKILQIYQTQAYMRGYLHIHQLI
jgi:hypothetical protein